MENKLDKNLSSLKEIKTIEEGKKFESYIGWSFSRELKCERYLLSVGFSLKEEKNLITGLIEKNNIKIKEQIITNLDKYEKDKEKEGLKSLSSSGKKLSQSESKSDKSKKTSSDSSNMKNKSKNNNININKDKKDKDEKKIKKQGLASKKLGDIYGDIDVVIPNLQKINFENMINEKFYHKLDYKCITFQEEELKKLPDTFHLLIETGLNVFHSEMPHKTKQIRKYISLINIRNSINDDNIKKLYIDDFAKRFSLNLNLAEGKCVSNKFVYMLISNSDYGTFTHRFFDNKDYEKEKNVEFDNISKKDPGESIFCRFIDFAKGINSNAFLDKKISEQKKEIAEQKKEIIGLKKSLHNITILLIFLIILFISSYIYILTHFIYVTTPLTHNNKKNDP